METIIKQKKIKKIMIKPTLFSMPVGSEILLKYSELISQAALKMAVSRINRDKKIPNEYEYRTCPEAGGFIVRRTK